VIVEEEEEDVMMAKLSTREKDRNPAVDLGFTSNASREGFRVRV
jgi:hypothetical protein